MGNVKSLRARRAWMVLPSLPLLLCAAGCAAETQAPEATVSAAGDVQPQGIVSLCPGPACVVPPDPGFIVGWKDVGKLVNVTKLAGCGRNVLWALDSSGSFYESQNGGHGWTWITSASGAVDIVCDGNSLYRFDSDGSIYATPGGDDDAFLGWFYVGKPSGAAGLYGGPFSVWTDGLTTGLQYSTTSTTNVGVDATFTVAGLKETAVFAGGNSFWAHATSLPAALANDPTARLTATMGFDGSAWVAGLVRTYMLTGGVLEYNDGVLPASARRANAALPSSASSAPANGWNNLPQQPPSTLVEISAAGSTLWGLSSTGELWTGTTTETDCFDGVDNDNNGLADEFEPSCYAAYASNLCAVEPNGVYCSSQFTDNPNFAVQCSGGKGTLVSLATAQDEGVDCGTQ